MELIPLLAVPALVAIAIGCGWGGKRLAIATTVGLLGWLIYLGSAMPLASVSWVWLPQIGLNLSLRLDGLAVLLIGLNILLCGIAALMGEAERPNLFYSLTLLLCGAVNGAFLAENLLLFFICYELVLVPIYLMIAIWGQGRRNQAALKFLIYTAVSGIVLLAAFLALYGLSESPSFERLAISTSQLPPRTQQILLVMILVAFGIKMPLLPLHTWLPDAYSSASAPVAILLGGVLSKLGTYGLVRFGLELFPDAWAASADKLAWWAGITVIYGALNAIAQKDLKRMVAYSSISHMGYIILGMAAATTISLTGVALQMVAHGLILALLFHLVGIIEAKVGSRDLDVLNGLLNPVRGLPNTSALLIMGGMASAGIPGLVGFVAEFLIFQGSYSRYPLPTLVAILGTGLTAVYFVILLNRTCFGKLNNATAYYPRVTASERLPGLILAGLIVWFGLQPMGLVRWPEPYAQQLALSIHPASAQAIIVEQIDAPAVTEVLTTPPILE